MARVIARRFAVSVLDALPEGITGIDTYMGVRRRSRPASCWPVTARR